MKKINRLKPFICTILSIAILFTSMPVMATVKTPIISDAEHKEIIQDFLTEIKSLQQQAYSIAQATVTSPAENTKQLEARINLVNADTDRLIKKIQEYYSIVPDLSDRNRHVLLTFNTINLVETSLYTLSLLIRATTDLERIELLDQFFSDRIGSLNTLKTLEEILAKFDS